MSEKADADTGGQNQIDPSTFRAIMAAFPTGVTVITTVGEDGEPKGFTSNAVTSVSMDPPLLLVCVALTSETLPVLQKTQRFVVNFLASGEHEVSNRFAQKGADKFEDLAYDTYEDLPVLREHTVAHAVCTTEAEYEAGDHIVLFGRVLEGDVIADEVDPLLYCRSKYTSWPRKARKGGPPEYPGPLDWI